jgi:hypothetical protein
MIRAYVKGTQDTWDEWLGALAGAYRATPHATTGFTPNMMMYGRELRSSHEVIFGSKTTAGTEVPECYGEYVMVIRDKLNKAHELARMHIKAQAERQKERYDVKKNLYQYEPGSLVWIKQETSEKGVCKKLQPAFTGPYVCKAVLNDQNCEIMMNPTKAKVMHHDKLKPYEGHNPPVWAEKLAASLKISATPLDVSKSVPELRVGDEVEVLDRGRWYSASIMKTGDGRIQIHYKGWDSQHDEWISLDSERLGRKIN